MKRSNVYNLDYGARRVSTIFCAACRTPVGLKLSNHLLHITSSSLLELIPSPIRNGNRVRIIVGMRILTREHERIRSPSPITRRNPPRNKSRNPPKISSPTVSSSSESSPPFSPVRAPPIFPALDLLPIVSSQPPYDSTAAVNASASIKSDEHVDVNVLDLSTKNVSSGQAAIERIPLEQALAEGIPAENILPGPSSESAFVRVARNDNNDCNAPPAKKICIDDGIGKYANYTEVERRAALEMDDFIAQLVAQEAALRGTEISSISVAPWATTDPDDDDIDEIERMLAEDQDKNDENQS